MKASSPFCCFATCGFHELGAVNASVVNNFHDQAGLDTTSDSWRMILLVFLFADQGEESWLAGWMFNPFATNPKCGGRFDTYVFTKDV